MNTKKFAHLNRSFWLPCTFLLKTIPPVNCCEEVVQTGKGLSCSALVNVVACFAGVVFTKGQGNCEGLQLSPAGQYEDQGGDASV